jgi:YggT family protein
MQLVLRILSGLLTAYSFILIFRVLVSLFIGDHYGRAWRFLYQITDPVLRLFQGIRFLRSAAVDFTPIAAIVALQVLASLLWSFSAAYYVSIFTVFAALLLAIWRIFFWILGFFTLVAVIRFLSILFSRRPTAYFYQILDNILAPPVALVSRLFPRRHQADYRLVLGVLTFVLLFLFFFGFFFVEPSLIVLCFRSGLKIF